MRRVFPAVALALSFVPVAAATPIVPVTIVVPVVEGSQTVRQADATGKEYPVFRLAPETPLFESIHRVLAEEAAQSSLRLDRYARGLLFTEMKAKNREADVRLTSPMYLLASKEEGGFARNGFWLERPDRKRELLMVGYVDLVVEESTVEDGGFEEIFCHELAHLTVGYMLGSTSEPVSPKMHQSMTVTDSATAFDEGYAEHFQPFVRDLTRNARVRRAMSGTTTADLDAMWLSRVDQELRTTGVKQNLFIYEKALMASALDSDSDRYQVFVDGETSTSFIPGELKNGQQMMASEGVVATLFYRMVNDTRLRERYREPAFYRQFFGEAGTPVEPAKMLTPGDNIHMKLLAAMRRAGMQHAKRPAMALVVEAYASLFPDEARQVYEVFLSTTRGATASQKLATLFRQAATEGRRGDIAAFRLHSREAFQLLDRTRDDVSRGVLRVDANLGPDLWLRDEVFRIAGAPWQQDRTLPFVMNLNTATVPELMTVGGMDCASARRIVAARAKRGFFESLDELASLEGVPAQVAQTLKAMHRAKP